MLAAGKAIVVFGGASGIPPGLTNAVPATTGALGLSNNTTETVTVKSSTGTTVDFATFDATLTSTAGVSANRSPDATSGAPFVLHTSVVSGKMSSPGVRADGTAF